MILLPDYNQLIKVIQQIALDTVNNKKPVQIAYGTVIGISPLQILVEQKMVLSQAQLVLTRNVTDFYTDMTVNHTTEEALSASIAHTHPYEGITEARGCDIGEPHLHEYNGETDTAPDIDLTHSHGYIGRKTFLIHNALTVGEKVVMLRMQGGQKFIVLDRVL